MKLISSGAWLEIASNCVVKLNRLTFTDQRYRPTDDDVSQTRISLRTIGVFETPIIKPLEICPRKYWEVDRMFCTVDHEGQSHYYQSLAGEL